MLGMYIPDIAMLPSACPLEFLVGGMQEPSIYALMRVEFEGVVMVELGW